MNDDFDDRLTRRLRTLDAAVPRAQTKMGALPATRSGHVSTRLPFGLAAALLAIVLVVGVGSAAIRNSSGIGAGPSASVPADAVGVVITNVEAVPLPGTAKAVSIVATIENKTGRDIKLLGASSPIATSGGLYATSGEMPDPSDATGIGNLCAMPSLLIPAGESIQLRRGAGEILLTGVAGSQLPGDRFEVTFRFEGADPATVTAVVVLTTN